MRRSHRFLASQGDLKPTPSRDRRMDHTQEIGGQAPFASLFLGPTQAPTRSLAGMSWAGPREYSQLDKKP